MSGRNELTDFERKFRLTVFLSKADIAQDGGLKRLNIAIDNYLKREKKPKTKTK